ncbi:peptidyl-prolyl cis-trans isomerase FKBP8 isoform X1 [Temnothorax americanus]|uniref:peptidyl-prolyl cis-trans isomerase FKBP8 isoform X1 n=2 Tax=Temnothorax americanus TaxID=1964332 RepID=UPI00406946A9
MTTLDTDKMDENVAPERPEKSETPELPETPESPETKAQDVSIQGSDCSDNSKDLPMESPLEDEQWLDILGNGQLKKRVIKKGEQNVKPQRGDICTVRIMGVLDSGKVVEEYVAKQIQIGDMEVVQGLDLTIVLMELGEIALVVVDPRFAYGTRGTASIPSNATITYTVELKEIKEEPEIETLSINQRREIGNKKRERGNWFFMRKDVNHAILCYRRALQYLFIDDDTSWNKNGETETVSDTELQALLDDCVKVYNNLAAALIETDAYHSALDNVNKVLKYQPNNTKALYRKGKIFKIQGHYGKAYLTFLEALKINPELWSAKLELASLKEKMAKQNEKEKSLYAKMLGINKESDKPSKDVKVEDKSKIAKGILWTLLGASAVVVGMLVHRFAS